MHKAILAALALTALGGTATAQTASIEVLARTCTGCHGLDAASPGASMPSIAGLPRDYLKRVMKQWKYGERSAITMNRVVKGFSDDELDALATYFSKQPWRPASQQAPSESLAKGERLVLNDCRDCHGATGGDPDVDAPRLDGQAARYMELELEKYRSADFKMPHRKMRKSVGESLPADAANAARFFGAQSR